MKRETTIDRIQRLEGTRMRLEAIPHFIRTPIQQQRLDDVCAELFQLWNKRALERAQEETDGPVPGRTL